MRTLLLAAVGLLVANAAQATCPPGAAVEALSRPPLANTLVPALPTEAGRTHTVRYEGLLAAPVSVSVRTN